MTELRRSLLALPAVLLVASSGFAGEGWAAAAAGLGRVKATGVLLWGGDLQGGEPYVFEDPARPGKLTGFEVEIADALARELGARAEFVQNDWSTLMASLERGTFDIALNGLEVRPARESQLRFSRPYYVFAERLIARAADQRAGKGRRVADLASLRGRRVGTLASSLAWDMLGAAGANAVPYEGVAEPFIDLQEGRIDAVLIDDIIADRYGQGPGLLKVADVASGHYAIGMRRADADLAAAVDAALGRMIDSGELRSILARWNLDGPRQDGLRTMVARTGGSEPGDHVRALSANQALLFLGAAGITLLISLAAMALAVTGGLLLAMARLPSRLRWRRVVRFVATSYVEVFRGTPVLLQLYVLYFGLAGVLALDAMSAAILGLGLNYAAYEAEIYRAGIQAVPVGQVEAAQALGMSGGLAFRRVVLPQAIRFSLPGVANDFIALLKDSSLVSVITVVELTKRMTIVAVDNGGWLVPGILCAALYFVMSYPLSRLARAIEARLQSGGAR